VMAERIAVMHDGRILQVGNPLELYDRPANAFVAGFLGRTNFLTGSLERLIGGTAEISVETYSFTAAIPDHSPLRNLRSPNGTRVTVAVRPEHINIDARTGDPDSGLRGVIADAIFVGATTTVTVDLGFATVDAVMVTSESTKAIRRGDSVGVSWQPGIARAYPLEEGDKAFDLDMRAPEKEERTETDPKNH
jgi:ABC-type Fe3+/spermidine/putrescine transport system ATPase subunit